MHNTPPKSGLTGFSIGCIYVELSSPSNILTFLQQHKLLCDAMHILSWKWETKSLLVKF